LKSEKLCVHFISSKILPRRKSGGFLEFEYENLCIFDINNTGE
jgi:hypothetical protein